jgi:hypothetical protein
MQIVNLYRYEDENGVVTITPNPRKETDTPSRLRLVADEGMILTDGNTKTPVVDILPEEADNWHEITDEEAESLQAVESEIITE